MQNASDQMAFNQAQQAYSDAMAMGNAYGYAPAGNWTSLSSLAANAPPPGTPTLQAGQAVGSIGYIPGYTGVDAGQTLQMLQAQAQMAAQSAGLTGFYAQPTQSQYTPGTFVRMDPSTYDTNTYGDVNLAYVLPSGQMQRVSTTQAKAMGWNGNLSTMPVLSQQQIAMLQGGPPSNAPQQTLQGMQAYSQLNAQAQQQALAAAQATGMYAAPQQIRPPGTNATGQTFSSLDQATQQAYLAASHGDWAAAMNNWVNQSNAANPQAAGAGAGGGTPTETLAAQAQYFNQAQQLAAMYGNYYNPAAPGQTYQAGVNGPQAGQQTLAAQEQQFMQGLQTQQFQQQAAQQYLQLLSQLQGPADYGQYLKVLGSTPGGIQGLVSAAAGNYLPGGGMTGQAPQAQTLQNLVGAATGFGQQQPTLAFRQGGPAAVQQGGPYTPMAQAQQGQGPQFVTGQWTGQTPSYTYSAPNASGVQTAQGNWANMQPGAGANIASALSGAASGQAGSGSGANAATATPQQGGTASPGGQNYQDFLATAQGLPPPSQIAPQSFNMMAPSQKQMLGSMYSNLGYAPGDINALYQQSLPKYAAGSASGNFRLV